MNDGTLSAIRGHRRMAKWLASVGKQQEAEQNLADANWIVSQRIVPSVDLVIELGSKPEKATEQQ